MNSVETDPITGASRVRVSVYKDRTMWQAVASVLREERCARGWTIRQLAEKVGDLTPQYVGMVERGKRRPPVHTLVRILDALDLRPAVEGGGRAVSFYTAQGKDFITVELRPAPRLEEVATPEWLSIQAAEDATKLGQIVAVIASDRERMLDTYRHLGLDEDFNGYLEGLEMQAEYLRGR